MSRQPGELLYSAYIGPRLISVTGDCDGDKCGAIVVGNIF